MTSWEEVDAERVRRGGAGVCGARRGQRLGGAKWATGGSDWQGIAVHEWKQRPSALDTAPAPRVSTTQTHLTNRQVGGNEVLLLINRRDVGLVGLLADDLLHNPTSPSESYETSKERDEHESERVSRAPPSQTIPSFVWSEAQGAKATYGDAIRVLLTNPLGLGLALVCSTVQSASQLVWPCCSLSEQRAGLVRSGCSEAKQNSSSTHRRGARP